MWNGAKKAMKRRVARQAEVDQQQVDDAELEIPNIAGEKFIVDLYKNLTNSTVHRTTQANTFRSLKYNQGAYFC